MAAGSLALALLLSSIDLDGGIGRARAGARTCKATGVTSCDRGLISGDLIIHRTSTAAAAATMDSRPRRRLGGLDAT